MNAQPDDRAPWSRPQRQALFGFPMMLIFGALVVAKVFSGPFDWPAWARVAVIGLAGVLLLAVIFAPMRGECPDERDRLIVMKSTRRAYVFLLLALVLPFSMRRAFTDGGPAWDAELLAIGIALLAQAVFFGSILLLYRGRAVD